MAAARANWKGYLRLSLVSCPVALFPATTESEKIRFHQLHKQTGNRIRYRKVDEVTGKEVDSEDIIKAYQVSKGNYIELTDEDLEAVAVESTRTIDIDEFVPRDEIDDLYNIRPYYIAHDGKLGADAFVTIREAIAATDKVALGRVVLTTREHVMALEPRGKGLMGTLLRYPYEVRDEKDYFEDIPNLKIEKEMLDLAKHIVQTKSGHFDPEKFEDRYEDGAPRGDQTEGGRQGDYGAETGRAVERHQPHGCIKAQARLLRLVRPVRLSAQANRQSRQRRRVRPDSPQLSQAALDDAELRPDPGRRLGCLRLRAGKHRNNRLEFDQQCRWRNVRGPATPVRSGSQHPDLRLLRARCALQLADHLFVEARGEELEVNDRRVGLNHAHHAADRVLSKLEQF
jgi:DNA end-binding protein Ku